DAGLRLDHCFTRPLHPQGAQLAKLLCFVALGQHLGHPTTSCNLASVAAKSVGSSDRCCSSALIFGMRSIALSASGSLPAWYSPTRSRNSTSLKRTISERIFATAS